MVEEQAFAQSPEEIAEQSDIHWTVGCLTNKNRATERLSALYLSQQCTHLY
jgi:hypothetical protein